METEWYYLDPDNNKKTPDTPHCARCKRKMKDTISFESFSTIVLHPNPDLPYFRLAIGVKEILSNKNLIGSECLKKVISEYGITKF